MPIAKFQETTTEMPVTMHQLHKDDLDNPTSQDANSEILGNAGSHHPNNHSNSYFSRGNQNNYSSDPMKKHFSRFW